MRSMCMTQDAEKRSYVKKKKFCISYVEDSYRKKQFKTMKLSLQGNVIFLLSLLFQSLMWKWQKMQPKCHHLSPDLKQNEWCEFTAETWARTQQNGQVETNPAIWPGVAPDEVGGELPEPVRHQQQATFISAPSSHLAGETDRRLPTAQEMTQKIWSFFLQRNGNLKKYRVRQWRHSTGEMTTSRFQNPTLLAKFL